MRVLVTGGAGFVGTNLIKRLLSEGHEVISVDNYSTGRYKNQQNHYRQQLKQLNIDFRNRPIRESLTESLRQSLRESS